MVVWFVVFSAGRSVQSPYSWEVVCFLFGSFVCLLVRFSVYLCRCDTISDHGSCSFASFLFDCLFVLLCLFVLAKLNASTMKQ